jgi:hypothetical protein
MKTKVSLIIIGLISSLISIVGISSANAECSANDPCGTWAVVDNSGTVTNIIVCQSSVCGSGEFGGQRVVQQVAPDSNNEAHGGYTSDLQNNVIVKEDSGTFTITNNNPEQTTTVYENVNDEITATSVTVSQRIYSFRYEDTINTKYPHLKELEPQDNTSATIFVSKRFLNGLNKEEKITFLNRETSDEVRSQIVINQFNLILEKISVALKQLGAWIKK